MMLAGIVSDKEINLKNTFISYLLADQKTTSHMVQLHINFDQGQDAAIRRSGTSCYGTKNLNFEEDERSCDPRRSQEEEDTETRPN